MRRWLPDGFVPLFDGKSLAGWSLVNKVGPGFVVENGLLVCPAEGQLKRIARPGKLRSWASWAVRRAASEKLTL